MRCDSICVTDAISKSYQLFGNDITLTLVFFRTVVRRRVFKTNPLKNRVALKRLNPYAVLVKKYAKKSIEQKRWAREILDKKKQGKKVTDDELKKASKILGPIKKSKDIRAERKARLQKIEERKKKAAASKSKKAAKK